MPELNEVVHDGPVAGQSLTAEFGARPWQSPPQYNTLEEALEWYVPRLTNKAFTTELFDIIEMGIPLTTIANSMQLTAVMEGVHSIDIGILVTPIIVAAALNKLKQEEDKPIPVPGIDSEVTEEEEPSGLMARRA